MFSGSGHIPPFESIFMFYLVDAGRRLVRILAFPFQSLPARGRLKMMTDAQVFPHFQTPLSF